MAIWPTQTHSHNQAGLDPATHTGCPRKKWQRLGDLALLEEGRLVEEDELEPAKAGVTHINT